MIRKNSVSLLSQVIFLSIFFSFFFSMTALAAPSEEWTYHKSDDGEEPFADEYRLLWLLNHARTNPGDHGVFLAETTENGIVDYIQDFSVDTDTLKNEFAALTPTFPVASDYRLYEAALEGVEDSVEQGSVPSDFVLFQLFDDYDFYEDGGYAWDPLVQAENIGYFHALLLIEGTFRNTSMSSSYSNAGIVFVNETTSGFAPNFGMRALSSADTSRDDHYNVFLVGTVWEDKNDNGVYDEGEGIGGVSVTPDKGDYFAVTGDAGGYSLPVTETGALSVTFSGTGLGDDVVKSTTVTTQSVLLDAQPAENGDSGGGDSGGGDSGGGDSGGSSSSFDCVICLLKSLIFD
jgi:hypothetical protein